MGIGEKEEAKEAETLPLPTPLSLEDTELDGFCVLKLESEAAKVTVRERVAQEEGELERKGEMVVDEELIREVDPDIVGERMEVGVEEEAKVVVGQTVTDVESVGKILLDDEPVGLHVGCDVMPVVEHTSQAQGMGVGRPGVGQ